jgi:tRNA A37 N6-isopentenylltransferase MiaA
MKGAAEIGAVLIAGPTASGKSALALALAESLGGTIINADSMQVYRDLRIITARPTAEEEARVPHRLYGHVDAGVSYSTGRWCVEASAALREAQSAGRLPIVVGGTGLYFKALTHGLAAIPAIPADVRARVRKRLREEGPAALHAELEARDPQMARRLMPRDRTRVARALEVVTATGRSLADWQRDGMRGAARAGLRPAPTDPPPMDVGAGLRPAPTDPPPMDVAAGLRPAPTDPPPMDVAADLRPAPTDPPPMDVGAGLKPAPTDPPPIDVAAGLKPAPANAAMMDVAAGLRPAPANVVRIFLCVERAELYARIDARFERMLGSGALAEVQALRSRSLDPALPAMKAHGVPWLLRHLAGEIDLEAAVEAAKRDTRRYSKRQVTWFRHQLPEWRFVAPERALAEIRGALER